MVQCVYVATEVIEVTVTINSFLM